ncbi:MAG: hybrid sensor histidine kinase/response regulator [Myxococcota bacterium]
MSANSLDILIVEDRDAEFLHLKRLLHEDAAVAYSIAWTRDSRETQRALARRAFDCILLDASIDDDHALGLLHDAPEQANSPILVIASNATITFARDLMSAGAVDVLFKERLTPTGLSLAIRNAIDRRQLQHTVHHQQHEIQELRQKFDQHVAPLERINAELHARIGELSKQYMERQARAQFSSIRVLSGGLAHTINNPLSSVIANLSFIDGFFEEILPQLEERLTDAERLEFEDIRECVQDATTATQRIQTITGKLSTIGKPDDFKINDVDICDIVRTVHELTAEELSAVARLDVDADGSVIIPKANENALAQTLLSLIWRARESFERREISPQACFVKISVHPSDAHAIVLVQDNAGALPTTQIQELFQPFHALQAGAEEKSLELPMAYSIVRNFGGEMSVDTDSQGTTFTMRFPLKT